MRGGAAPARGLVLAAAAAQRLLLLPLLLLLLLSAHPAPVLPQILVVSVVPSSLEEIFSNKNLMFQIYYFSKPTWLSSYSVR